MIPEQLAARGILQSGETPYQLGEEEHRYAQAQYDAQNALMQELLGGYYGFSQNESGRGLQMVQAQQDAALRAQDRAFQQAQMNQEMQFRQQELAAAQAASAPGDGGGDPFGYIDELFAQMNGGGGAGPSQGELDYIRSITRMKGSNRSAQQKQELANFQAQYGAVSQYS